MTELLEINHGAIVLSVEAEQDIDIIDINIEVEGELMRYDCSESLKNTVSDGET